MFASCFPSSNEDLPLDLSCKTIREEDGSPSTSKIESDVKIPIIKTIRNRERCLLPCQVCGKAFDRPSLLKRHIRTHTGEKPHVCDVCGKGFSTSSSLNTHRRIHSGEKPHQCPICGKRFTASSNLYYHRMTHVKEKPHKCTTCHKSFPTPGDLKSHMYVHNGSWPFHCHFCKRGFSKQTNLRNHLFLHTGKKPHSCSHCGKCFALACNLRAHMRTHSEPSELKNHQGKTASSNSDDANKDANGRNHHLVNNIEGLKGEEFLLRQQDEESLRAPSSDNDRLFHNHSQQFNHPASASVMLAHHQQVGVGSSPSSALVDHVFFWHTLQQQLATSILANSVRHHHHDQ